jgi:phosphoribosylpyrophosphate synthetase
VAAVREKRGGGGCKTTPALGKSASAVVPVFVTPRQEDWDSNKIVKCIKGEPIKGYVDVAIGGTTLRVDDNNKEEFLRRLWNAFGQALNASLTVESAIVPIPNRIGIVGAPANYRTLQYAKAIAAASSGKVIAVDALRWKKDAEAAHKQKGFRTPERRYENLTVVDCPKLPIILFDDMITSGSSFVAACWRLDEAGNAPKEGFVAARRTTVQEPKMFVSEQRELEIPQRPVF